jgi:hypothetical protein
LPRRSVPMYKGRRPLLSLALGGLLAPTAGPYRVDPIYSFWGPKPRGGVRRFAVLSRRDTAAWEALAGRVARFLEPRLRRGVVANRALNTPSGWRLESTADAVRRARTLVPDPEFALHTDVEDFYASVDSSVLARCLAEADVPGDDARRAANMLEGWQEEGYLGLPVGPPGSAILANAVLRGVDEAVGSPFLRWVDDYVIPIPSEWAAVEILERIDTRLSSLGLRRSVAKTDIRERLTGVAWIPSGRHAGGRTSEA